MPQTAEFRGGKKGMKGKDLIKEEKQTNTQSNRKNRKINRSGGCMRQIGGIPL